MPKNYQFNRYFNLKFVIFIVWEIRNTKKWDSSICSFLIFDAISFFNKIQIEILSEINNFWYEMFITFTPTQKI